VAMKSPDPSAQTPSESLVSGADPVSEAQGTMDGEGTPAQPDYVGKAAFDALQQKLGAQDAQLRGLQGVLDKQTRALADQTAERTMAEHEVLMDQVPADLQPALKFVYDQNQEMARRLASLEQGTGTGRPEPDALAKEFVRESGANPDDPRIDYSLYDGSNKGTWAFIESINAVKANASTQAPLQPVPSQPTPRPPSPGDTPASHGAGAQTEDQIVEQGVRTGNYSEMRESLIKIKSPLAR